MPFTESNYENAVLQLFTQTLGHSYAYGPDIERDYHSPLYEDELLPALRAINPDMPQTALDDAVYKLKNFESGSLLQKNMVFADYLQNGVPVKFVVKDHQDLMRALELIRAYGLTETCHVFLSPVYGEIEPEEIVNFMKSNNMNDVTLQLQIHKVIWDSEMRGV